MLKHLLTGEELSAQEISKILKTAMDLKSHRQHHAKSLKGCHLALLFEKQSLRTRFSFTIAMRELGGDVVESTTETSKNEYPEDTARVLSGYCHAIMLRTHADTNLQRMASVSSIPIINGLSADHHPCQIFADFMTLSERFGRLHGLKLAYIGDGNNILHSLLLLGPRVGIQIHYATPPTRGPSTDILQKTDPDYVFAHSSVESAVHRADAVYTDVWTSMGFKTEDDESLFNGFQVNEQLMGQAKQGALFMHCMPMIRGKEVSHSLPDKEQSVIFQQSENRLHVQKALLLYLLNKNDTI